MVDERREKKRGAKERGLRQWLMFTAAMPRWVVVCMEQVGNCASRGNQVVDMKSERERGYCKCGGKLVNFFTLIQRFHVYEIFLLVFMFMIFGYLSSLI